MFSEKGQRRFCVLGKKSEKGREVKTAVQIPVFFQSGIGTAILLLYLIDIFSILQMCFLVSLS